MVKPTTKLLSVTFRYLNDAVNRSESGAGIMNKCNGWMLPTDCEPQLSPTNLLVKHFFNKNLKKIIILASTLEHFLRFMCLPKNCNMKFWTVKEKWNFKSFSQNIITEHLSANFTIILWLKHSMNFEHTRNEIDEHWLETWCLAIYDKVYICRQISLNRFAFLWFCVHYKSRI